jgi:hypothetical protein
MPGKETEFCRRQAERLQRLAQQCVDARIRKQVNKMAAAWAERAGEREAAPALPQLSGSATHLSRWQEAHSKIR